MWGKNFEWKLTPYEFAMNWDGSPPYCSIHDTWVWQLGDTKMGCWQAWHMAFIRRTVESIESAGASGLVWGLIAGIFFGFIPIVAGITNLTTLDSVSKVSILLISWKKVLCCSGFEGFLQGLSPLCRWCFLLYTKTDYRPRIWSLSM